MLMDVILFYKYWILACIIRQVVWRAEIDIHILASTYLASQGTFYSSVHFTRAMQGKRTMLPPSALHASRSSNIVLFWEDAWSPPACAVLLVSPLHKLPPPQPLLAAKEFVWSRSGGGAANRMGCAIHVHLRHSSRQSGRFLLALTYIRAVSLCSVHHVMPWHAEMNGQSTGVAVTRCFVDS